MNTQDDNVVTTIRLPRDQHSQLVALAKSEHRTLSQELRRMVEQRLADHHSSERAA